MQSEILLRKNPTMSNKVFVLTPKLSSRLDVGLVLTLRQAQTEREKDTEYICGKEEESNLMLYVALGEQIMELNFNLNQSKSL
jgi:hypothetical protein